MEILKEIRPKIFTFATETFEGKTIFRLENLGKATVKLLAKSLVQNRPETLKRKFSKATYSDGQFFIISQFEGETFKDN